MESWQKALIGAAGVAGVGALLYCLLKEEPETKLRGSDSSSSDSKKEKGLKVEEVTKEQVRQILKEIVELQEKMRTHMKALTKELLEKALPFEQTYQKVKEMHADDPLERHGLSMMDFDQLLDKHQSDPQVREGIARIMGMPEANAATEKGLAVSPKKIIEVHSFMLEELEKLVRQFGSLKNKEAYDMKTVTIAAQVVVGAKVEEKFGLTSEDIECAVIKHHTDLATNQEFAQVNMRMQQTMGQLMGGLEGPP